MSPSPFDPSLDPSPSSSTQPANRVLVVASREDALDELLRLAAAAAITVDVASDLAAAGSRWRTAPFVVVDESAVVESAAAVPKRSGVVLVGHEPEDSAVWRRAFLLHAEHVVFLPTAESWLVERMRDARDHPRDPATVVGVVGGRGGAGASTLAVALAVTAVRRDVPTMLVDLDPLGGGIDLVLGAEDVPGLRWRDLTEARGRLDAASLRAALPSPGELPVLAWDRGADVEVPLDATCAVLDAATRSSRLIVVDLPRHGGLAAAHAAGRADLVLMVVPADIRAVASAERVARCYRSMTTDLRVVTRLGVRAGLGGLDVSEALALPSAGELARDDRLAAAADRGEPPAVHGHGPLARWCGDALDDLLGVARAPRRRDRRRV